MNNSLRWLATVSIVNLLGNSLGTVVSLAQNLAARLGSVANSQSVLQDFLGLKGTALSAPLSFMLIELALVVLALQPGWPVKVGIGGLTFLGLFFTVAQAGEPIVLQQFSSGGFDLTHSVILLVNIVSAAAMFILGIRAWRGTRASFTVAGESIGGN